MGTGYFLAAGPAKQCVALLDVWQSPGLNAEEFVLDTWRHTFSIGQGLPGRIWQAGSPPGSRCGAKRISHSGAAASQVGLHGAFGFPVRVGTEVEASSSCSGAKSNSRMKQLLKMVADVGLKIGQFGDQARAGEALRRTEAQLQQSQKMEPSDDWPAGRRHDFNNMRR